MTDAALERSLEWLKDVAGVDDEYLANWPREAWAEWARAMRAAPTGPNPSVPEWMRPVLGRWHNDFSGPFPCVAQLWPTTHDWFAEADTHDDFRLEVSVPYGGTAPSLSSLRQAWALAQENGATPLLHVLIEPAEPWGRGVAANIESFYVVAPGISAESELGREFELILGTHSEKRATYKDAAQLMGRAGRDAASSDQVLAWEWMYVM